MPCVRRRVWKLQGRGLTQSHPHLVNLTLHPVPLDACRRGRTHTIATLTCPLTHTVTLSRSQCWQEGRISYYTDVASLSPAPPIDAMSLQEGSYSYYTDVAVMIFIGFGFLMTFLKK